MPAGLILSYEYFKGRGGGRRDARVAWGGSGLPGGREIRQVAVVVVVVVVPSARLRGPGRSTRTYKLTSLRAPSLPLSLSLSARASVRVCAGARVHGRRRRCRARRSLDGGNSLRAAKIYITTTTFIHTHTHTLYTLYIHSYLYIIIIYILCIRIIYIILQYFCERRRFLNYIFNIIYTYETPSIIYIYILYHQS